jgi:hypothetical protein
MKPLLALLLLAVPFFAQSKTEPCNLTIAESPTIRGLKLGMTQDDFKKSLGDPTVTLLDKQNLDKSGLENVKSISFNFYQDRLSDFNIRYDDSAKWNSVEEFARAISGPLKLPVNSWRYSDGSAGVLECKEFEIAINTVQRFINVWDKLAAAAMAKERKEIEDAKKKAIKP